MFDFAFFNELGSRERERHVTRGVSGGARPELAEDRQGR